MRDHNVQTLLIVEGMKLLACNPWGAAVKRNINQSQDIDRGDLCWALELEEGIDLFRNAVSVCPEQCEVRIRYDNVKNLVLPSLDVLRQNQFKRAGPS
jgi:hypothetical protein